MNLPKKESSAKNPMELRYLPWLMGIVICAFAVRVLFVLLYHYPPDPFTDGDAIGYDIPAQTMLAGKGFLLESGQPTAQRTPIYPLFLAVIYLIFGRSAIVVQLIQSLVDTVSCYLIFVIALKVFESRTVAVVSALLYAFYFPAVKFVGCILTETLFTFLLLVFVITFLRVLEVLDWKRFLLSGVVLGITSLCKPTTQLLPFFLIILLPLFLIRKVKTLCLVRNLAILAIATVIILTPWAIRNYLVFGYFTPASSIGGKTFYYGNHLLTYGLAEETVPTNKTWHVWHRVILQAGMLSGNEFEQDKMLFHKGLENIKHYTLWQISVLLSKKFFLFWVNWKFSQLPLLSIAYLLVSGILVMLSLVGFFTLKDDSWTMAIPLISIILYFVLTHVVITTGQRLSIPIMPYIIVFAASSGVLLGEKILRGQGRKMPSEVEG